MKTRESSVVRFLALLSASAAAMLAQTSSGISGKIADQAGNPVPAAQVRYQRLIGYVKTANGKWVEAPGQAHVGATVAANALGGFAVSGLPAGDYTVCAYAPGYLRPCEWSGLRRITLAAAVAANLGTVQLEKSAIVAIRVDDPLGLLPQSLLVAPPLALGIRDDLNYYHAAGPPAAVDASGRTYQIDVPYGRPMRVWLQSWKFSFTDGEAAPLASAGALIPFEAVQSAAAPAFTVRITGEIK
jgi:hypothetical protein